MADHAKGRQQIAGKSEDLFVLSKKGGAFKERESNAAVMEWARAMRQMCVSVTDVFWVRGLGRVSGTWRININPSKKRVGVMTLNLFQLAAKKQKLDPEDALS